MRHDEVKGLKKKRIHILEKTIESLCFQTIVLYEILINLRQALEISFEIDFVTSSRITLVLGIEQISSTKTEVPVERSRTRHLQFIILERFSIEITKSFV
jgi:hypothetical protein